MIDATTSAEQWSAEETIRHMVERFHPRLYIACSFQKETSVIVDLAMRVEPRVRFFTLDTGLFFEETYAVWRRLEQRYGIEVEAYQGISLARQAELHGDALWARDPDACCGLRKLAPLRTALSGADAWITGVRREQSTTRASTPRLHWDATHALWKGNPLVDWSYQDVNDYVSANDIPCNELHDRGYASIGCTHCTQPGTGREGRWAGSARVECGLHGAAGR